MSADGFLDDRSEARLVLSTPRDLSAVHLLRAEMDAIMVGAETVRRDNPSLITRSPECAKIRKKQGRAEHPIKVTVTASGDLDPHAAFFTEGETEKIVLVKGDATLDPAIELGASVIRFEEDWWPVLEAALLERGANALMIEGGAQLIHYALDERIADHWRIAVADKTLGDAGHAHVLDVETLSDVPPIGVTISKPQAIGGMQVYWVGFDRELLTLRAWMDKAFALAANCPASESAYSVGAIGLDADGHQIAKGWSRASGPKNHAEEELIKNLPQDGPPLHTVICTLEPCNKRGSKKTGCAKRLIQAGVKRLVIGVLEPAHFTRQNGIETLQDAGIEIVRLPGYEPDFAALHTHLNLEEA